MRVLSAWCAGDRKQAQPQERENLFCLCHFAFNSFLQRVPVPSFGVYVCVFHGGAILNASNPQMPAGCPKIQPSSHTVYPEGESDLTGKGLSPVRPSTADPKTGHRLEVSGTSSLGFIHLPGWFTELTFWGCRGLPCVAGGIFIS